MSSLDLVLRAKQIPDSAPRASLPARHLPAPRRAVGAAHQAVWVSRVVVYELCGRHCGAEFACGRAAAVALRYRARAVLPRPSPSPGEEVEADRWRDGAVIGAAR